MLAERAAWDLMAEYGGSTELVTVLSGAIFGPAPPGVSQSSTEIIARMLSGRMRAVPRIEMNVVDVRDLADLHVQAMTATDVAGRRFLQTSDVLSMAQMSQVLGDELGQQAVSAQARTMPDFMLRLAARFSPELGVLVHLPTDHRVREVAQDLLGWRPRPARETVVDTGCYLLPGAGESKP